MKPLIVHADWSTNAHKRWMSVATSTGDGWRVGGEAVGGLHRLLGRLRERAGSAPVALGIDAPIGMPSILRAEHADFLSFLRSLTASDPFFTVNSEASDISRVRPFYPFSQKVGGRHDILFRALGVDTMDALRRECERKIEGLPAAWPMFWTLGARQVGKAAIVLWRDLLLDALRGDDPPALWPFDDRCLATLLQPGRVVIAETYPANAMRQIKLGFTGSKRQQDDRQRVAPRLRTVMAELGAEPDAVLADEIERGFPVTDGDDRFDSLVGLLHMLQIIGDPAKGKAPDTANLAWEGWILGRPVTNP